MTENFLQLHPHDQRDILNNISEQSQRPSKILEKDIWVVWTLDVLFKSNLSHILTFKGGTSLSKAYNVIDRFSEDIDLTVDIRQLLQEWIVDNKVIPDTRSQVRKWTNAVNHRLPVWISEKIIPSIDEALLKQNLDVTLEVDANKPDTLLLHYPTHHRANSYIKPCITLEFGGRATGEPHQKIPIKSDIASYIDTITFPSAMPQVMTISRTFWEKITALHVYCRQSKMRSERYSRHWFDVVKIMTSKFYRNCLYDTETAKLVIDHKNHFFATKDRNSQLIDYNNVLNGNAVLVPTGEMRKALESDFNLMNQSHVMINSDMTFESIMQQCKILEMTINQIGYFPP
jgi:hypothetical protein